MKQYIYSPAEAGLETWPPGELRLDGFDVVSNPNEADVFVVPGNIRVFETHPGSGILDHKKLYRLPYLRGNESRTAVFDVSDNFKTPINLPLLFIRCDVRTWMLPKDTNTIPVGWPVEDYQECVDVPEGGFKYDVSFHGWLSTDTRIEASKSCKENSRLKCDIAEYIDFTGYIYYTPEGIRRRKEFRRSMTESRVSLCGESIPGVMPYRFYEALSAGRVPFLISSDYVLPFADVIPYNQFTLRAEAKDAPRAGEILADFLLKHSDGELREMGLMARKYWVEYLDSRQWPKTMAYAVTKQLQRMGVTQGCG